MCGFLCPRFKWSLSRILLLLQPPKNPNLNLGASRPKSTLQGSGLDKTQAGELTLKKQGTWALSPRMGCSKFSTLRAFSSPGLSLKSSAPSTLRAQPLKTPSSLIPQNIFRGKKWLEVNFPSRVKNVPSSRKNSFFPSPSFPGKAVHSEGRGREKLSFWGKFAQFSLGGQSLPPKMFRVISEDFHPHEEDFGLLPRWLVRKG